MFVAALVASLLPALSVAQYGGPPPGPGSPTTSSAVVAPSAPPDTPGQINVDVSFQNQYMFNPNNFSAPNGTQVTFWFPGSATNNLGPHSVTQSSFNAPCTYLSSGTNNTVGFDSGLQEAVTYSITIMDDTQPIWFHCKQVQHCGMGMVGSINAPTTGNTTFSAFLQQAINIGINEPTETDSGPVTGGLNGVATALPAPSVGKQSATYNIPLVSFASSLALLLLMV